MINFNSFQSPSKQKTMNIICPISNAVMVKPVKAPCGHVFDYRSILKHLMKESKCPLDKTEFTADQLQKESQIYDHIMKTRNPEGKTNDNREITKEINGHACLTEGELQKILTNGKKFNEDLNVAKQTFSSGIENETQQHNSITHLTTCLLATQLPYVNHCHQKQLKHIYLICKED